MGIFDRLAHRIHGPSEVVGLIETRFGSDAGSQLADAIDKAKAGGIPWLKILMTILPLLLPLLSGGTIDIQALIAAILALLGG